MASLSSHDDNSDNLSAISDDDIFECGRGDQLPEKAPVINETEEFISKMSDVTISSCTSSSCSSDASVDSDDDVDNNFNASQHHLFDVGSTFEDSASDSVSPSMPSSSAQSANSRALDSNSVSRASRSPSAQPVEPIESHLEDAVTEKTTQNVIAVVGDCVESSSASNDASVGYHRELSIPLECADEASLSDVTISSAGSDIATTESIGEETSNIEQDALIESIREAFSDIHDRMEVDDITEDNGRSGEENLVPSLNDAAAVPMKNKSPELLASTSQPISAEPIYKMSDEFSPIILISSSKDASESDCSIDSYHSVESEHIDTFNDDSPRDSLLNQSYPVTAHTASDDISVCPDFSFSDQENKHENNTAKETERSARKFHHMESSVNDELLEEIMKQRNLISESMVVDDDIAARMSQLIGLWDASTDEHTSRDGTKELFIEDFCKISIGEYCCKIM